MYTAVGAIVLLISWHEEDHSLRLVGNSCKPFHLGSKSGSRAREFSDISEYTQMAFVEAADGLDTS